MASLNAGSCSILERHVIGGTAGPATLGIVLAPAPPDFLGELSPLFLGGLVDDAAPLIVRASPVLDDGLNVLGQGAGAGVVLPRPTAPALARHALAEAGVTGLAQPAQIRGVIVRLLAVPVVHYQEPARGAQFAPARCRRYALLRPVARGAVADLLRWLAPAPGAGPRYSSPSASSSSSSSGATMFAISSSWSSRASFTSSNSLISSFKSATWSL